jgi:hypothetical protein
MFERIIQTFCVGQVLTSGNTGIVENISFLLTDHITKTTG